MPNTGVVEIALAAGGLIAVVAVIAISVTLGIRMAQRPRPKPPKHDQ